MLVNNAGVGLYGPVEAQDPAELEAMVQLNVSALTNRRREIGTLGAVSFDVGEAGATVYQKKERDQAGRMRSVSA